MKKILILLVILALAGGGAYYYFFMMQPEMVPEEEMPEEEEEIAPSTESLIPELKPDPGLKPGTYIVSSSSLNVRFGPSSDATIARVLDIGEKVDVIESENGWARISEYHEFIDGKKAQWVSEDFLGTELPDNYDEVRSARLEIQIKKSDDFILHRAVFLRESQKLIDQGVCSNRDFEQTRGWLKSRNFADEPVYYTYCGGLEREHKIYLNVAKLQIFRP